MLKLIESNNKELIKKVLDSNFVFFLTNSSEKERLFNYLNQINI